MTKTFIYPQPMTSMTNQTFQLAQLPPIAQVIPSTMESPVQQSPKLTGVIELVSKSGKPYKGRVDLQDGTVKLSFNEKGCSLKIGHGTYITSEGDEIKFYASKVKSFVKKEEIGKQLLLPPVKKEKAERAVRVPSQKNQLIKLMEDNNRLLSLLASKIN